MSWEGYEVTVCENAHIVTLDPHADTGNKCPTCGGWFWISLTAWHAYAAQQKVGTEQFEYKYDCKTNTKEE